MWDLSTQGALCRSSRGAGEARMQTEDAELLPPDLITDSG